MFGSPLYGIKTGLNHAFIISKDRRDSLLAQDQKSADLLVPFLRGEDIKRWCVEPEELFLINTPKGKVDIDAYPAVRDWLLPFKPELERRATKQKWFELQQAQLAYQSKLSAPKIIWSHFQVERTFALETAGFFLNNKCFFFPVHDQALLAILNSACLWFQLISLARLKRGEYIEAEAQYVEQLALPTMSKAERGTLAKLGESCSAAAKRRFDIQASVRHRILDLAPREHQKLSRKLQEWWGLDFSRFRAETKRLYGTEIPVKERAEWEGYLRDNGARVHALTAEIEAAEREIDAIVYRLFDLTSDEIKLLAGSIGTGPSAPRP